MLKGMNRRAAQHVLTQMTLARPGYGQDGREITMHHHVSSENVYDEDDHPGRAVCAEYWKLFGHLYG